ncbi:transketolase C-terminal domain-containing protein [Actinokineospora enzanensis]|uniref:transketolase C-terminal domain-containing protein n=1 Tax=Actinokineospora enzanensis TaxID=155975 RepID=UPI00035EEB69|nr:transketolase C-terminal domain-containing protein [Actinokineospora enzanensis]
MTLSPGGTVRLGFVPTTAFAPILALPDRHDRCRAFADAVRVNTLYSVMRAGSGHIGSSFSAADIVSWLLLEGLDEPFAPDGDIYFSSKGHDAPSLYAALIALGQLPEADLHRLRRLGGLPGHPDVRTPHMHANTGSLGMGISRAKGFVLGDRLTGRRRRVVLLTGDGELQEGQNWEALAGAVHREMGELTVVVDHNKLQSDTWVRDVSDLGDLEAKFRAFGWAVLRCDGNSAPEFAAAFARREREFGARPAVIIADTVKGAGATVFAATSMPEGEWMYRFHSGAPDVGSYREAHEELVASVNAILRRHGADPVRLSVVEHTPGARPSGPRLPEVYGRALTERAAVDERIVALDADLVLDTGLIPFKEQLPDRFVECGIAEQDMVSMAGGMAARGLIPFAHSFSCFLHARPNEQMYTNATEDRKVVYVGSLAGLLPAAPGHSHQAVRDVSAVGAIPGLVVLEPVNSAETVAAVEFCADSPHSVYLRLVSTPVPEAAEALPVGPLVLGRGRVVRQGGRTVAIGSGPVVIPQLLHAAELLDTDLTVVNLPWLNRVDAEWLARLVAEADHLVVVENHYTRGGQADLVARCLLESGLPRLPTFSGLGLTELPACGAPDEVLDAHGLSAAALAAHITQRSPRR